MRIVFLSNFLNHHQKPLSDELYKLTNGEYAYIETEPMEEARRQLGYQDIEAPYVIKCYNHPKPPPEIVKIINEADAVIIGSAPDSYITTRTKCKKLTFKYTERLYKDTPGILKLLYHRLRFRWRYDKNKNCFLLCASAYAAEDFRRIGCFKDRAFKWGYFPEVNVDSGQDEVNEKNKLSPSKVKFLWVGRLLSWKHPEIAILLAEKLYNSGMQFELNMYGIGPEYEVMKQLIQEKKLSGVVKLNGAVKNKEILRQMHQSDIFLFTSDRKEGWGAVANEAMSNGCVVVASDAIGSTPFLIEDGVNGLIFSDGDTEDLFNKVIFLVKNPERRSEIAAKARLTMQNVWNPQKAAKSLLKLIDSFEHGKIGPEEEGPCSKA